MIILPAVDIKDGRCVRLKQGKAEDCTVYGDDPVEMAKKWADEGGKYLHVVDLDGAFGGKPANADAIAKIAQAIDIPVEVGGGLRTDDDVRRLLDAGVSRAIIGTRALSDKDGMKHLIDEFGDKVAVGIDAKDGLVQVKGWVETSDTQAVDLARQLDEMGVATLIYTDTSRDGMLKGVNLEATSIFCDAVSCQVVASGGVTSEDDITGLLGLEKPNLCGVIVGKALYDGRVDLRKMNEML